VIELLSDGGVKWNDGGRQEGWKLRNNGTLLEIEYNGVRHELRYENGKGVLMAPSRSPQSTMKMIPMKTGSDTIFVQLVYLQSLTANYTIYIKANKFLN
jgi:hypothetical protein